VPHSSIDTEAHWTKSGWHGWVYGGKLHRVVTVAAVWIPLAAEVTPANAADNESAPRRLPELPPIRRFLLGDTSYDDPALRAACDQADRVLITSKRGPYPHTESSRIGASRTSTRARASHCRQPAESRRSFCSTRVW
jgi:hypothetical protein